MALFFGQIAPYKGLEYLVDAVSMLAGRDADLRLVIAGKVKQGWGQYLAREPANDCRSWHSGASGRAHPIRARRRDQTYFMAADVLVLPYTQIFRAGFLFLAYGFGLPVIASDVGSLRRHVLRDGLGFVSAAGCRRSRGRADRYLGRRITPRDRRDSPSRNPTAGQSAAFLGYGGWDDREGLWGARTARP